MFTQNDIEIATNYKDFAGSHIYYRTDKGAVRFLMLNMHTIDLNKLLSRKIQTQGDFDALKKAIKKQLKNA